MSAQSLRLAEHAFKAEVGSGRLRATSTSDIIFMEEKRFDILIVGGGSAGISIASRLVRMLPKASIGLVEPAKTHFYQPIWTLVGAGVFPRAVSERDQSACMPKGVNWILDGVKSFSPDNNQVMLRSGRRLEYGELIVTLGIQLDWGDIKGLSDTLGRNGVCSNYSYASVAQTAQMLQAFDGGTALFTFPDTPIKCAGAPQKIMYLAEELMRDKGVRDRSEVVYMSATANIFGIERYRVALEGVVERRGIKTCFRENLVEVRASSREAVFRNLDTQKETIKSFDFMHVTPPQSAPDVVKQSPLANDAGWVDVDRHTLQHLSYPNVWSSGDCSSLPVSKTGAAVRKQVPVLVENLLAKLEGRALTASYDGYASCPLVTGRGKAILAEFGYEGKIMETFPFDQSKERFSMYALKAYALPRMYWHGMLRGRL